MNIKKILFLLMVVGLGSSAFSNNWKLEEKDYQSNKYYKIIQAPEKYENLIGTFVYSYKSNNSYKNLFTIPCKERMLYYLQNENFEVIKHDGITNIFLPIEFLNEDIDVAKRGFGSHALLICSKTHRYL